MMMIIADLSLVLIVAVITMANVIAVLAPISRPRAAISYDISLRIVNVDAQDDISLQAVSSNGVTVMEQVLTVLIIKVVIAVGMIAVITVVMVRLS